MSRELRLLVTNNTGYPAELSTLSSATSRPDAVRAAVASQERAGVDLVMPGYAGQADPVTALTRGLEGLKLGGAAQRSVSGWGEVTIPVLYEPLRWTAPIYGPDVEVAHEVSRLPVKVSLAGPYTFASLMEDPRCVYDSFGARIEACAQAIGAEVRALAALGVAVVQVEEPLICEHSSDFPRLREGLLCLRAAKGKAALGLTLWGDAICPLYDWLQTLPVDLLGLDLVHSRGLAAMIGDRETSRTMGLGLVECETVATEPVEAIHRALRTVREGLSASEVHLQPSGSLGGLSPEMAEHKLAVLAEAARTFEK